MMRFGLWVAMALVSTGALAQGALPDRTRTPGATNPNVTPATIGRTICVPGWTKTVRPPTTYTTALKRQQIDAWHYKDQRLSSYEEDHLIPLTIGGAPRDPRNLWPEPIGPVGGWTALQKDQLELRLNKLVCSHQLSLAVAQKSIATDWTAAYRAYVQ